MRSASAALLGLLMLVCGGTARADAPGKFDYYVMSLSWSPQFCAAERHEENDPQCVRPYGFVVHGLWPQHERGWPQNCGVGEYVGNDLVQAMLPYMPSKNLILHEWRKHGVCSGLRAREYFAAVRKAADAIVVPKRYRDLPAMLSARVTDIEREFIRANPSLNSKGIAVQCRGRFLGEVRICLNKDLSPRECSSDVRDRCGQEMLLRPTR